MTDLQIAAFIIDNFEGGRFTDDPLDAGGPTRYGITRPYLAAYLRSPVAEVSQTIIRNLSREKALEIFVEMEFSRGGLIAMIDWRPKLAVVDFGFNAGHDDSVPALQRAVGVKVDGIFGRKTFEATTQADPVVVAVRVTCERLKFHVSRTSKVPSQRKWLGGWVNRCSTVLQRVTEAA